MAEYQQSYESKTTAFQALLKQTDALTAQNEMLADLATLKNNIAFEEDVIQAAQRKREAIGIEFPEYRRLIKKAQDLATFTKLNVPEFGPMLYQIRVESDAKTILEHHLEEDNKTLNALVDFIVFSKAKIVQNNTAISDLKNRIAGLQVFRTGQVTSASTANAQLKAAYLEVTSFIDKEVWARWLGNTFLDMSEVAFEGKNPAGALMGALG